MAHRLTHRNSYTPDISNGDGFPFLTHYQDFFSTCREKLLDCEFYRFAGEHMLEKEHYHPRLFVRYPVFELPGSLRRFACSPRFVGKPREVLLNLLPPCRRHAIEFCGQVYLDGTKDLRRAELLASRIEAPTHFWLLVINFCASTLRSRKWPKERATDAANQWVEFIRYADRWQRPFQRQSFWPFATRTSAGNQTASSVSCSGN